MTAASTYMGRDKAFIQRSLRTLPAETELWLSRAGKGYGSGERQVPKDIWQDIFAKYLALADPAAGLAQWDRWGSVESGDTRSHTLHWLLALNELGPPDLTVTADTALYSVFRHAGAGAMTRRRASACAASGKATGFHILPGPSCGPMLE